MRPPAGVYASNVVAAKGFPVSQVTQTGGHSVAVGKREMMGSGFRWGAVLLGAALITAPAMTQSKDSFTPMPMDKGFGPMDLTPPTTPPEEIVKKFAAKESEFQDALNHYTYRRVMRVQTLDDDNKVDGELYQVDDVIFDPSGK